MARPFFRRRKSCPFSGKDAPRIDYKDVRLLQGFVSERGKIVPSRITAVSTKKQRELAKAIKRARHIGLRLARKAGTVLLEIEDDGVGLVRESEGKGAGLGLMRHRAQLIGAELTIKTKRGGGVVVSCRLPLPA